MKKLLYIWTILSCTSLFAAAGTISLENDRIAATFDAKSGALVGLVNKASGWKIMDRAVLGQSFELLLPLEGKEMTEQDYRFNVVKGIEQQAPVVERSGDRIVFTWSNLKSPHLAEPVDVTFRGEVRLTDTGLEYGGELINDSPYPVEYVSWPCIGEVSVPDKSQPLHHSTRSDQRELFPHHFNQHGYWGVDYPTSTYELPERSYLQVSNRDQGFMFYTRDAAPRYMVITSFELIPGFEIRSVNPYEDQIDGELVRIQFKSNQVVYNKPGERTTLDPVRLAPYAGPWTAGVDIYRKDRATDNPSTAPAWLREPLTWWKVGIGSGDDLLRYARQAAGQGVGVLQVRGWYRGTDAGRIEQVAGLDEAIAACRELGVRVVLETNWYEVNTHMKAYAGKYEPFVMKDPFGWAYNRSLLCPLAPEFQQIVKREWLSLPALRAADGYLNNDPNHRDKTFFCFDEKHGHRAGEATANGVLKLDREIAEAVKADGAKAALGFGFLDSQQAFYDGYSLNASEGEWAKRRYLDPLTPVIAKAEVRRARRDMNQALLNRFNIAFDLNFHGSQLEDYPHIAEYGRRIKALRERYAAELWNAEFVERQGAQVNGPDLSYSVFAGRNGKRAVVVVNMGTERASKAEVTLSGASAMAYASPEDPAQKTFGGSVEIAPQSAVVIFEK